MVILFSRITLLDFDPRQLQQTGEHNESATLPILAEIGLRRYGEIPLWNPYMLTGFPHAGDLINHFWNPVATLPVLLWGGINGMKVSVFLSLLVAAFGQWFLAHTFGLRGIFRLWAGLLFALSGGLLLLWRLGWYELLVGAAWFPWCFALLWRALHRHDRSSLVWTALSIALVLTAGGGYYPFYLGISLIVLTVAALAFHKPADRGVHLRRAAAVAILSIGLAAVYLVPLVDGLRYTRRDAPPDVTQVNSQPIPYALFNYVVSDESWFRTAALNRASGYGWFYIGALPLLALAFTPWLFGRFAWRRRGILTLLSLLLVLLLWHANRHAPVRYLYEWFPFLFTFRFPNRLLIFATIPLVILAAMNMQGVLVWLRRAFRGLRLNILPAGEGHHEFGIRLIVLINLSAALLLLIAMVNVYRVNYHFVMHPNPRLVVAEETLGWLRLHDTGLYYINIGGPVPNWSWVAHAYELEMPVFNFRYNRRVLSMDAQYRPESPFNAQPKYVILSTDQPMPEGATLMTTIRQMNVWYQPQALPYAFAADPTVPITRNSVGELAVHLDGPNRVIVDGAAVGPGRQLVVLVSDYPGWRLTIDGRPAQVVPVNGYLGAEMMAGEHTYVFEFRPVLHTIGLSISGITLLLCAIVVAMEGWRKKRTHHEYQHSARSYDAAHSTDVATSSLK
ncbi:MAG: hypothetical protein KA586_07795 [Candidatus Promineofilum sp.]|nr:hypothetical protein [Promineifilum sp.]